MLRNNYKLIIIIIIFLFNLGINAQTEKDYKFSAVLGGGYSYYLTDLESFDLSVHSFAFNLKLLWEPEHLLSAGIETGFYPMYHLKKSLVYTRYGITSLKTSLTGIPMMLFFSMEIFKGLQINGSLGGMLLFSKLDSFDNPVSSSSWSTTFGGGISYDIPLGETFSIRTDMKWIGVRKMKDDLFSAQIGLKYTILSY